MLLVGVSPQTYHLVLAGVFVVFCVACVAWGRWAEERFGRKDPRFVVADEVAGQCIALALAPTISDPTSFDGMLSIVAFCSSAFLLFRIFDITKPPPAHSLQRLKGGVGILIDDLLAGLYALVIIQIVMFLLR
jgi:phosphatidylglycerophosphatase A